MFQTRLWGGKAFAAEQKIREFKKLLLRGKRLEKQQRRRPKTNRIDLKSYAAHEQRKFYEV